MKIQAAVNVLATRCSAPLLTVRAILRVAFRLSVACGLSVACAIEHAAAGELIGKVTDSSGAPIADAVIALYPNEPSAEASAERNPGEAIMDQRGRQFSPHVLVIQRGAAVRFPNSDDIRHQVYSFSAANRFNLPLYHGVPAAPVKFERTGEVVLGCNIHDQMLGYIYVVDSPWFGKTDAAGALKISDLPAGSYRAQLWYPGLSDTAAAIVQKTVVHASGSTAVVFNNAVQEALPTPSPSSTRGWGARRSGAQ